eukprot:7769391-Pyramimonas_sp.AAC.1
MSYVLKLAKATYTSVHTPNHIYHFIVWLVFFEEETFETPFHVFHEPWASGSSAGERDAYIDQYDQYPTKSARNYLPPERVTLPTPAIDDESQLSQPSSPC